MSIVSLTFAALLVISPSTSAFVTVQPASCRSQEAGVNVPAPEATPTSVVTTPTTNEALPPSHDATPATNETTPPGVEATSSTDEVQALTDVATPPTVEALPTTDEVHPPTNQAKPRSDVATLPNDVATPLSVNATPPTKFHDLVDMYIPEEYWRGKNGESFAERNGLQDILRAPIVAPKRRRNKIEATPSSVEVQAPTVEARPTYDEVQPPIDQATLPSVEVLPPIDVATPPTELLDIVDIPEEYWLYRDGETFAERNGLQDILRAPIVGPKSRRNKIEATRPTVQVTPPSVEVTPPRAEATLPTDEVQAPTEDALPTTDDVQSPTDPVTPPSVRATPPTAEASPTSVEATPSTELFDIVDVYIPEEYWLDRDDENFAERNGLEGLLRAAIVAPRRRRNKNEGRMVGGVMRVPA